MAPLDAQADHKVMIANKQEVGCAKVRSVESYRDDGADSFRMVIYEVECNVHVEDYEQGKRS